MKELEGLDGLEELGGLEELKGLEGLDGGGGLWWLPIGREMCEGECRRGRGARGWRWWR